MIKYVCLAKLRLESFVAWKLEHILRGSNDRADAFGDSGCIPPNKRNSIRPYLLLTDIINYHLPGK